MGLFRIKNTKLEPVSESPFKLERGLQALTEANLNTLFGLEFIATEFERNGLRIDTLAYDPENKSFVIIEYKRDQSFTIVDQGFAYLSLMFNNKAEFVLEYNTKKKSNKNREDFDWSQARVLFIARSFTTHQQHAVNFKNIPFELWEVECFEDSLVQYRKIEVSTSAESLEHVKNIASETRKVAKEVRQYTEEDVVGADGQAHDLYMALKEKMMQTVPELVPRPKKIYIGYRVSDNWRNVINIGKIHGGLAVHFTRSNPKDFEDPKNKLRAMEHAREYYGQDVAILEVKNENDIRYAILMMQQAYDRFIKKFGG